MAEQLVSESIQAPGFYGINRQDAAVGLGAGFALAANNCVIDKFGRMGARKGWLPKHTSIAETGGKPFKAIFELIGNDGTSYILGTANNKLFKLSSGTLTQLTYGGGGTTPTITADHWQAAALNNKLVIYQEGHDPLIFDPALSTTAYRRVSEHPTYSGSVQSSNCVISAYGRTWSASTTTNKNTIQFSDILIPCAFTGGTSGSLDVAKVWPLGADTIMALAAHNGYLFVFGRRQILVYQGASDPSTMSLSDTITGVGCQARDSVVATGTDIVFLSDTGVRSLMRTVQEKSSPMRELSINVKDDMIAYITAEASTKEIKAGYSDQEAFYLITFPTSNVTYCFDMRNQLPNGAARTTTWTDITPRAYCYTSSKDLLMGRTDYISYYTGYKDNTSSYRFYYYTNYMDFNGPTTIKILKKINVVFIGVSGATAAIKYAFDYSDAFQSQTATLEAGAIAEFGVDEYSVGVFSTGVAIDSKKINAGGNGTILQLGIETDVFGNALSVQKIDCYVKTGRTK